MPRARTRACCSTVGGGPATATITCSRKGAGSRATACTICRQFLYGAVPALLPMTRRPAVRTGQLLRTLAPAACG
ncbi:hypothetical protein G6F64_014651 [Rhizopus arrhizus]|uniref:Uncharacterized protein n=1 Tax=Rhizopus oryzae TaxID=64495 RepID=A0A9P6WT11_RHIOR|nr:hypothetical protein G6F64_014651 [Rhizopus arrhizus]